MHSEDNELKQQREAFLLDMLHYYTPNPAVRRCINTEGKCYYSPEPAGKVGLSEGCAIGRRLPKELQDDLLDCSVSSDTVFDSLPQWMHQLERRFLHHCQILHDGENFWDLDSNDGLSSLGKYKLKDIIKIYGLDPDLFTAFLADEGVAEDSLAGQPAEAI